MASNDLEPHALAGSRQSEVASDTAVAACRIRLLLSRYRLSLPIAIVVAELAFQTRAAP
jgi:hypothetical protein